MNENMKILSNRVKRWSFKQRLHEIQLRLAEALVDRTLTPDTETAIDEAQQIVDYWMDHMTGEIEKPKKKKTKKEVNLWK